MASTTQCIAGTLIRTLLFVWWITWFNGGCTSERRLLNEENSFYKQGIGLQQEGSYEDAIAAFEQCLRYSPESYKANLQLALIYEDHKREYPQAIVRYKLYLAKATDVDDIEIAERWLNRAEKKYFEMLRLVYGDPIAKISQAYRPDKKASKIRSDDGYISDAKPAKEDPVWYSESTITEQENRKPDGIATIPNGTFAEKDDGTDAYYIVKEGDTFVDIAEKLFGDQENWQDLFEYNKDIVESPELLQIGQKLRIPPLSIP